MTEHADGFSHYLRKWRDECRRRLKGRVTRDEAEEYRSWIEHYEKLLSDLETAT